jgi:hypothetical protein
MASTPPQAIAATARTTPLEADRLPDEDDVDTAG